MKGGEGVGYAVVHMMKIKTGGLRGIQSHNNREKPPRTNPDIDKNRTPENYDLIPCDSYRQTVKGIISTFADQTRTVRKDAVVCCNFIVTSDEKTMKAMSPEKQQAFFEESVKWFAERYGGENIVNATVHMDETTPHLHIGIVPVTSDGRLCAKDLFNRREMSAIQTDFVRDVGAAYGLERGKEGSERTHLSEQRFKAETARREMEAAKEKTQEVLTGARKLATEGQKAAQRVKALQEKEKALQGQIQALEGQAQQGRELKINEVCAIQPQRTLTGAIKGVSVEDIENLKRTAVVAVKAVEDVKRLSSECAQLSEKCKALEKQVPSIKEKIQQMKDKERLTLLEKVVAALPADLREKLLPSRGRGRGQGHER